jgi:hypothetical protein
VASARACPKRREQFAQKKTARQAVSLLSRSIPADHLKKAAGDAGRRGRCMSPKKR